MLQGDIPAAAELWKNLAVAGKPFDLAGLTLCQVCCGGPSN
jgi:hypothetical protein